jgi:Cytochrome b/b6/petB/LAGLIDADG endonuclease
MRLYNKVQVLKVLQQHLGVYPTPMNLNWNWSWGSLSGLLLGSQIVTGILLAMHYVGHVDHAFASVQHLMVDVPSGLILRYAHANGASLFFTVVYLHILRGLYYSSGNQPREILWISGVVILLLMIITAFIGYVLPWGQMSFWGATVITSLATTIPVVGKQIVYWLWGGFSIISDFVAHINNNMMITLLGAGNSHYMFMICPKPKPIKVHGYDLSLKIASALIPPLGVLVPKIKAFGYYLRNHKARDPSAPWGRGGKLKKDVKILCTQAKPAGTLSVLQRLNAEDLAWFVGFVEGDGSFSVNKNGKYLKYEFAIELSRVDIQLLHKIKSLLGVGNITTRTRNKIEFGRFKISSKDHLKNIIAPIFTTYPMLTSKQHDFLHMRDCLEKNITYYEDLPKYERPSNSLFYSGGSPTPTNSMASKGSKAGCGLAVEGLEELLAVPYFDNWLVGFIEAEGCFSFYQVTGETNMTASFSISQKDGLQIISAITARLGFKSKPSYKKHINMYEISSPAVRLVQNVIDFLHHTPAKLKGNKRVQFLKWLSHVRVNARYLNVTVPSKY